jgi:hypothetical protein
LLKRSFKKKTHKRERQQVGMFLSTQIEKRRSQRVVFRQEAESILGEKKYSGNIENFSKEGILKIIAGEEILGCSPGTTINVNFQIPSGETIELSCEIKWLRINSNMPFGVKHNLGMEIVDPPQEYTEFVESLYSKYL